jgi:hypothetical protein
LPSRSLLTRLRCCCSVCPSVCLSVCVSVHTQPMHFLCVAAVGILPWVIACYIESYFAAILAAGVCLLYTFMLISQLWCGHVVFCAV